MAINATGSAITAATVATAMGGTVVLGGGNAVAGNELAAGSAGYLATTAANSTTTMVRDTISNFENYVGSALADYMAVGTVAGRVTMGVGNDKIVLGENDSVSTDIVLDATAIAGSVSSQDLITNFVSGSDNIVTLDSAFALDNGTTDGAIALATVLT